ncbi:SDR family NAD(P)-dependent oxidoreductase [Paractinoplanes ferrugineus]|uniref:Short-chain dehydrogenase n=1 Tax=Paractinoplanes ferrugineus TaxID=113564 RepID=A0A919J657_9ACTN|nr:3-oxoacyl-ACP reductase family protein [Actinoplanes ferrugineus]GIE13723.1 short-chain dehydrogenase [Actinoplanes ferrugineus]
MSVVLDGKKVLVTGGSRGIGRAIVLALAGAGADVMTCYRSEGEAVDSLARELKSTAGDHHLVRADVSDQTDLARLIDEARQRYGRLDALVNNAGVISHIPFAELSLDEWRRVLDNNLTAPFEVTQRALPLLPEGASVVTIGSRVATIGIPLRAHYTAAKSGLIGLTRSLAKELGGRGIRVNVVAPGPIETEEEVSPQVRQRYQQLIALRRLGRPEEVANAVLFLVSDLSTFVSGETINVDGGI